MVKDTYQEGSTIARASQPHPAGAGKYKGPAGRKMGEKRSQETAKTEQRGSRKG